MTERLRSYDNSQGLSSSEIIGEISKFSRQISEIYALRDGYPDRFLPQEEYTEIRRLHELKDQKTIDLLLQNQDNPNNRFRIVLQKYSKEKIHPFSMNKISIFVPHIKDPNSDYLIKSELSDLRRAGVLEDSLQAETLLGEKTESYETGVNFAFRTASELVRIRDLTRHVLEGTEQSKYTAKELGDLSSELITNRLLVLKNNNQLPQDSSLSFFLVSNPDGSPLGENTQLVLKGKIYDFPTSGQRLAETVKEYGGYDRLITLNT